jgi:RNA polymerase sigma-70 factor (ECF subfamily)
VTDAPRDDVTELLLAAQGGSSDAVSKLMPVVYAELKSLAAGYLRAERADHTLQTTGLVHEAYLKLVDQSRTTWKNRSHFFGIAAQAMRRILVDHARKRSAGKRDGGRPVTLDDEVAGQAPDTKEVLAVDEALERLAALDPRQARIVELRYFTGLSVEQTAEALEISPATVKRDWTSAKAWLQRELAGE